MAQVTVKQSGGDYGSLNAACAAGQTDILISGLWTANDTTKVASIPSGAVISADSQSRHPGSYDDSLQHYRLVCTGGHCITANNACTIKNIAIVQAGTGTSDEGIRLSTEDVTYNFQNLVLRAASVISDQDGIYHGSMRCTVNVTQCVGTSFGRAFLHPSLSTNQGTITWNVNSCLGYKNGTYSGEANGGGICIDDSGGNTVILNVFNTGFFGTTGSSTDFNEVVSGGSLTWYISNCSDSDNSIASRIDAGTGNLASRTLTDNPAPGAGNWVIVNQITQAPYNLRIVDAAENDALLAHSTTSAHGMTIPSTDIIGNPRPDTGKTNHSIGAFSTPMLPRLGYTTLGGSSLSAKNRQIGSWFQAAESGDAQSITVGMSNTTTAKRWKCAIFEYIGDNDAGALLREATERTIAAAAGNKWETFTLTSPYTLVSGTKYFFIAWAESLGGNADVLFDSETAKGIYKNSGYNGLTDPMTGETPRNDRNSIYVTYTTGGAPTEYTKTTSLNALIKKSGIAKTVSIDALVKKSFSKTLSIDALIAQAKTGTLSLDAVAQALKTETVSLDALVQAAKTGVISLDAVLLAILTQTVSLDAVLTSQSLSQLFLDGLIQSGKTTQVSVDSLVQQGHSASAILDSLIKKEQQQSIGLDANVKKTKAATAVLDALIRNAKIRTVSLDAILISAGAVLKSVALDALVQALHNESINLDALVQTEKLESISIDALLIAEKNSAISLDSAIQSLRVANIGIDAIISTQGEILRSISLDALIRSLQTNSISIDAALKKQQSQTLVLDAILSSAGGLSVGLDALVMAAKTGAVSLDALTQLSFGKTVSLDALLAQGATRSISFDALVAIMRESIVSLDGLLRAALTKSVSIDAIIGEIVFAYIRSDRIMIATRPDRDMVATNPDRILVARN